MQFYLVLYKQSTCECKNVCTIYPFIIFYPCDNSSKQQLLSELIAFVYAIYGEKRTSSIKDRLFYYNFSSIYYYVIYCALIILARVAQSVER